jgi:hypothetical protein
MRYPVSPALLGLVQRRIGVCEQSLKVGKITVPGIGDGDPKAHRIGR